MIGGTSIAVPPQALAQQGREQEQSAPDNQRDSDNPLRSRPVVANPRPDPKPAESSGVPNYEIDPDTGRTIWSIEEPAIDIAESDVEVSEGKPVPVPDKEIPEGSIPGESVYLPDMSDEYAHVFLNPDSTLTVTYTELPSVIDEQTGLPATESTVLKSSPRGWEIATSRRMMLS